MGIEQGSKIPFGEPRGKVIGLNGAILQEGPMLSVQPEAPRFSIKDIAVAVGFSDRLATIHSRVKKAMKNDPTIQFARPSRPGRNGEGLFGEENYKRLIAAVSGPIKERGRRSSTIEVDERHPNQRGGGKGLEIGSQRQISEGDPVQKTEVDSETKRRPLDLEKREQNRHELELEFTRRFLSNFRVLGGGVTASFRKDIEGLLFDCLPSGVTLGSIVENTSEDGLREFLLASFIGVVENLWEARVDNLALVKEREMQVICSDLRQNLDINKVVSFFCQNFSLQIPEKYRSGGEKSTVEIAVDGGGGNRAQRRRREGIPPGSGFGQRGDRRDIKPVVYEPPQGKVPWGGRFR